MNCNCDHHETCAVCVPSLHGAKRATPHEQLIDELRDSTVPKTEREHAAAREIEKNQDRIAAGHRLALELGCLLLDTKDLPTVSRWWASGMEALDAWQKLFPYNGPRLATARLKPHAKHSTKQHARWTAKTCHWKTGR